MKSVRTAAVVIAAFTALITAPQAVSQNFPTRSVRMVVPFPPGAASDFLARTLGQKLGEAWGQQVVIDNRPGAGGLIGGTVVAHANADGYTIALIGQPHLTATLLARDPPWHPLKDFAHIGQVATMANVVTVGAADTGESQAGLLQLRIGGHRQLVASGGRDVQRRRRAESGSHPVQIAR
jgi:tripartite-type tricarboxylate transporter receptor subunit TctC